MTKLTASGRNNRDRNFMRIKRQKRTFISQFKGCGGDMEIACKAVGTTPETVKGWVIRDEGFRGQLGPAEEMFEAIAQGRIRGMVPRALDAYQELLDSKGGPTMQEKVATRVLTNEGVLRDTGNPVVAVDNRSVNIYVRSERTKNLLGQVGERVLRAEIPAETDDEYQND